MVSRFSAPAPAAILQLLLCAAATLLCGCGYTTDYRVTSRDGAAVFAPRYVTSIYRKVDDNTADIFLSDLPREQIAERLARCARGLGGSPATVVHLRLFLVPQAGRTPIEFTASNVAITHLVMTGASSGVYGGGGFLLVSSSVGSRWLTGRMRAGTVRLTRSVEGFVDRLGPSRVAGEVAALRDDQQATEISAQMIRALNRHSARQE